MTQQPKTMRVTSLFLAGLLGLSVAACKDQAEQAHTDPHDAPATAAHDDHDEAAAAHTTIPAAMAAASGIRVATAGPALLRTSVDVLGRIDFAPAARAEVRARYVGEVRQLTKTVGDKVRAGELLARIESSQSLQTYAVTAPISGVVLERRTNVGDVAGEGALYVIGDLARVQAELHVFPGDLGRIRDGQAVTLRSLDEHMVAETRIAHFLPTAEAATQTLLVRASVPNDEGRWLPGMAVQAGVVVAEQQVALAVARSGLQRFRGAEVVFVRRGDVYEARPLVLGRQSRDWAEVLSGLAAGEIYVTANSFLVKADIEKSGAGHDH